MPQAELTGFHQLASLAGSLYAVGVDYRTLQRIVIFSSLRSEHLRQIAMIASEKRYKYNEFIFREGDAGDRFYLIQSGKVRISREVAGMGEEALAILKEGDYFGEMSLIDDFPRSADAKAHEACVLQEIEREAMEELLLLDKDLTAEILRGFVQTLSSRLRETNDKMTFLAISGKFS